MGKKKTKSFYAIAQGRVPGIYCDWPTAEKQIKGYKGQVYKGFATWAEADLYMASHGQPHQQPNNQPNHQTQPPPPPPPPLAPPSQMASYQPRFCKGPSESANTSALGAKCSSANDLLEGLGFIDTGSSGEETGTQEWLPELDSKQREALNRVRSGGNIMITGVAGTGKSLLLKHIIRDLKANGKRFAILAPTGIAAVNIGGCTLHS